MACMQSLLAQVRKWFPRCGLVAEYEPEVRLSHMMEAAWESRFELMASFAPGLLRALQISGGGGCVFGRSGEYR
jgi:hypothetical protein